MYVLGTTCKLTGKLVYAGKRPGSISFDVNEAKFFDSLQEALDYPYKPSEAYRPNLVEVIEKDGPFFRKGEVLAL